MFQIIQSLFCWLLRYFSRSSGTGDDYGEERAPLIDGQASSYGTVPSGNLPNSTGVEDAALVRYEPGSQETLSSPQNHPQNGSAHVSSLAPRVEQKQGIADLLEHSESSRDFLWKCTKYVAQGNTQPFGVMALICFVFAVVFVAWTSVGILSAYIASDRTGLSSLQHCGIYQFDDNAGDEAAYRNDLYNRQKEEQASQYARNCYDNPAVTDALSCGFFYNQSIAFTTKTQQPCPFPSSEMCFKGLYSAISFDTGLVDASTIGINSPTTYKFRRRTSCSPLNISEPYIEKSEQAKGTTMYSYNYGSLDDAAYTFNTSGHPFEWLVPVYSAK